MKYLAILRDSFREAIDSKVIYVLVPLSLLVTLFVLQLVINAGTVSSQRLRGKTRPCYNLIEITDHHVDVWRKYPFHGQEKIIQFSTETRSFEKYTARIEGEVTSHR